MGSLRGFIVTPNGTIKGRIDWEGSCIDRVIEDPSLQDEAGSKLPLILPGFIDLHVHGGAGRDVMDGGGCGFSDCKLACQTWHHLDACNHDDCAHGSHQSNHGCDCAGHAKAR